MFSVNFLVAFCFHLNFRSASIWDGMQEGRYICCNEACASPVTCWLMLLECLFSLVPDCDSFYSCNFIFFLSNNIKSIKNISSPSKSLHIRNIYRLFYFPLVKYHQRIPYLSVLALDVLSLYLKSLLSLRSYFKNVVTAEICLQFTAFIFSGTCIPRWSCVVFPILSVLLVQ